MKQYDYLEAKVNAIDQNGVIREKKEITIVDPYDHRILGSALLDQSLSVASVSDDSDLDYKLNSQLTNINGKRYRIDFK